MQFLTKADLKLYHAYLVKESLRPAFKVGPDEISYALSQLMAVAQRYRIPVFRDLRKKIKRYFSSIVSATKYKLSNARSEAISNIKLIIRSTFGLRNVNNLATMVMLSSSALRPVLPSK